MKMVDSGTPLCVSAESIAEDDTFFRKMLGLVQHQTPPTPEMTKQKESEDETPNQGPTVPQEGLVKNKKQKQNKLKKKQKRKIVDDSDETDEVSHTKIKVKKPRLVNDEKPTNNSDLVPSTPNPADMLLTSSIAEMDDKRARLRAKIEELQVKRKLNDSERLDKKRLKRKESKMKLKQKRKMEKLIKVKPIVNGGDKTKGGNTSGESATPKPIYNSEGQLVFSKFDFTASGKKAKGGKSDLTGKDYKRLLEKIEKRNEKIRKVGSKDEGAAKSLQEKFKWESVLHKAEGEKVKDNPELLKKALKRKEKIKDKKKQKWDERKSSTKKLQDDKLKKRNENIQKRKQANKDKKVQKAKKKGRILPGF
ncbi:surfeit locus protein 6 homolog [Mya arenaria]|uniref:surfeit locus protein 6 homolog n=1 Tax=Mya arenaria TaxID=6604 RepID=UPI0022E93E21|nr:surfeit locus protein 6 homolog [Mya arenaria]